MATSAISVVVAPALELVPGLVGLVLVVLEATARTMMNMDTTVRSWLLAPHRFPCKP